MKSIKDQLKKSTIQEYYNLVESGKQDIHISELEFMLDEIGYYIDQNDSFNYINNLNEIHYNARSISIKDKHTKLDFSNINANRDNLAKLQQIRKDYFCFYRGRIWEL
mgnify:CR=1 FL=1